MANGVRRCGTDCTPKYIRSHKAGNWPSRPPSAGLKLFRTRYAALNTSGLSRCGKILDLHALHLHRPARGRQFFLQHRRAIGGRHVSESFAQKRRLVAFQRHRFFDGGIGLAGQPDAARHVNPAAVRAVIGQIDKPRLLFIEHKHLAACPNPPAPSASARSEFLSVQSTARPPRKPGTYTSTWLNCSSAGNSGSIGSSKFASAKSAGMWLARSNCTNSKA